MTLTETNHKRRNAWFAWIGAPLSLTGMQLVSPGLPALRDALDLTNSQLALVSSVYMLPAALGAIPAGIIADRIGRRRVFGWCLVAFGIAGVGLTLVSYSFELLLTVRFLQGIAFAGLLPLSMTILGDSFTGRDLVAAQGRRSVAMSLGDGTLPIIGGLLVALGWYVPWLMQAIAIPFGLLALRYMHDLPRPIRDDGRKQSTFGFIRLFKQMPIVWLEYAGFLRMLLKFSVLAYFPVLIDARQGSAALAGVAIGVSALAGTVVAASAGRLADRNRPTVWLAIGFLTTGFALTGMGLTASIPALIVLAVFYGASDGLTGVFLNALVTAVPDAQSRASFVSATGAVRNLGKFAGPLAFGLLLLSAPVSTGFVIAGVTSLVSTALIPALRPIEHRLISR